MRTLVTGISTNSTRRPVGGFTLIEILVVLLIIGIMITGAVLATGIGGGDRDLEKERDRIVALTDYLREQAALQNREYGMRFYEGGYEFVVFNVRTGLWQQLQDDSITRPRPLPAGILADLSIEGRAIILPKKEPTGPEDLAPQVLLYSSGELNLFELVLRRDGGTAGFRFAPAENSDRIEVSDLAAAAS
jgi:general secretion pathway protein H